MENSLIQKKFKAIGANISFGGNRPFLRNNALISLDIASDKKGEHFVVENPDNIPIEVLDIQPDLRHLLLMVRGQTVKGIKNLQRFLCGHDERHWFIAAVPEHAGASTVKEAMEALKPKPVRNAQVRSGVKSKDLHRRKTASYVRQGEWFFVPRPDAVVKNDIIHKNEPLRRGRGKPHIAEFLCRRGGELVYVSSQYDNGIGEKEYQELIAQVPEAKKYIWRTMVRNASVFVKGRISHPDHSSVILDIWHEVIPNTENESKAFHDMAFLD